LSAYLGSKQGSSNNYVTVINFPPSLASCQGPLPHPSSVYRSTSRNTWTRCLVGSRRQRWWQCTDANYIWEELHM